MPRVYSPREVCKIAQERKEHSEYEALLIKGVGANQLLSSIYFQYVAKNDAAIWIDPVNQEKDFWAQIIGKMPVGNNAKVFEGMKEDLEKEDWLSLTSGIESCVKDSGNTHYFFIRDIDKLFYEVDQPVFDEGVRRWLTGGLNKRLRAICMNPENLLVIYGAVEDTSSATYKETLDNSQFAFYEDNFKVCNI